MIVLSDTRPGLVQTGFADLIIIRDLFEANELFDPNHNGRVFSVLRYPVDCASSTYINLMYNQPELANMILRNSPNPIMLNIIRW